ncbi:MAG: hypothetical protein IKV97_06770 [Clostridia bacterium]|nr:hypothetical protein [Clostridia bacterium]
MKTKSVKFLAFVLSLILVIGTMPAMTVFAEETGLPASRVQNLWHLLQDESETELKIAYL